MGRKFKPVGQQVHEWLSEPEGETFELGKWRFWWITVAGLQAINALLTALIFKSSGDLQNYMGAILFGVGALVGWIAIGALHYSGATDRKISRVVSLLDSITLLFVVAHFAFLMWAYGRLHVIQKAEAKYEIAAQQFNGKADKISGDNVEIARALQKISENERSRAKLENDTAYQTRKAAEAGAALPRSASGPVAEIGANISTSKVELEKPEKPEKSSAKFLTDWDTWIRAANFGELLLCALTLISIRNLSAARNIPRSAPPAPPVYYSPASPPSPEPEPENFPDELDGEAGESFAPAGRENFTRKKEPSRKEPRNLKKHASLVSFDPKGLKKLRETLKDISFQIPGFSFKAYVKGDAVWVFMMRAVSGTQETAASAKFKLSILDDAAKMPRGKFREKLEGHLRQNGFQI